MAERLDYVLREMKWNQADLARAVKASEQSTVGNWFSGRNKTMEPRFAFLLQDEHYWSARWLLEGEGPPRLEVIEPEKRKILEDVSELPLDRLRAVAAVLGL